MTVFLAEAGVQTEAHDREKKKTNKTTKIPLVGIKMGQNTGIEKRPLSLQISETPFLTWVSQIPRDGLLPPTTCIY